MIETIRQWSIDDGNCPPDRELSEPSLTWLDRMKSALADEGVAVQKSFDELLPVYEGYLAGLPDLEAQELHIRIGHFIEIRDLLRGFHEVVPGHSPTFARRGRKRES